MLKHNAGSVVGIAFAGTIAVALFVLAWLISNLQLQIAAAIIIGLAVAGLSFFKQDIAALAIIAAMIFSPEIGLGSLPGREIVVRFDDIILIVFFMTWLFKTAYFKNLNFIRITPLNAPILAYILAAFISTWVGIANGNVKFAGSILYFIKYVEYFMIYFMFSNIIRTEQQLKSFMGMFFAVAAATTMYGLYQMALGIPRISTPFEGEVTEANTFGGYLLLVIGLAIAVSLKARTIKTRAAALAATAILIVVMIATLSRASYLGLAMMALLLLIYANRNQRRFLLIAYAVFVAASPLIMPQRIKDRVMMPFSGETEQVAPFLSLSPRDSSYTKFESAAWVIDRWKESPVFGKGVTGVGIVDTQYPRILGEMGVAGAAAFIWLVFSLFSAFRTAMRELKKYPSDQIWFWRAIVVGYILGFAGILTHGLAANTFIIVRIMEPFWFLAATVVAIPHAMAAKFAAPPAPVEKKPERKYALQPWIERW
ncbi:MAG TPA: hypothetical protein PLK80_04385 [bacterium]|nr:hypothetical protein [bacterium]